MWCFYESQMLLRKNYSDLLCLKPWKVILFLLLNFFFNPITTERKRNTFRKLKKKDIENRNDIGIAENYKYNYLQLVGASTDQMVYERAVLSDVVQAESDVRCIFSSGALFIKRGRGTNLNLAGAAKKWEGTKKERFCIRSRSFISWYKLPN